MCLKTPSFWYGPDAKAPAALLPLSWLYGAGVRMRTATARQPHRAKIPVICVGNLTAGGSGKTPFAISLLSLIKNESLAKNPCFLTRGYGGKIKGPVIVDSTIHRFTDVGDEALLLARQAPVIVSRNRAAGADLAAARGFDLIVMDDGLQNPGLYKDISFAVIDGATGVGNGHLIPAGPLREPIDTGLARADAVFMVGPHKNISLPAHKPIFSGHITSVASGIDPHAKYFAFCGIGRPEKFFQSARESGLSLARCRAFADHHAFNEGDIKKLKLESSRLNARLLTTEKDAMRLPDSFRRDHVTILPAVSVIGNPAELAGFLRKSLSARP